MTDNDITFDKRNYRRHSDANKRVIKRSLEECGAGRSVLLDADNSLIAGNGVYEQAQKLKLPVRVIETDGKELIALKRTDLHTDDERRRLLALADNAASDTSDFDIELLQEDFDVETLTDFGIELKDEDFETEPTNLDAELEEKPFSCKITFVDKNQLDEFVACFQQAIEDKFEDIAISFSGGLK